MSRSPLCLAVGALLLAGWGGGLPDSSLHVRGRSGPLELSLSFPKAEYAVGEPVQVTLTLRNLGPGPVGLRPASLRLFDFAVFDEAGRQLGTWAGGRPFPMAPPLPISLAPGEAITRTLLWDLALPGPDGRTPLPPGRYGLQGFLSGGQDVRGGFGRLGVYPLPLRTPLLSLSVR